MEFATRQLRIMMIAFILKSLARINESANTSGKRGTISETNGKTDVFISFLHNFISFLCKIRSNIQGII